MMQTLNLLTALSFKQVVFYFFSTLAIVSSLFVVVAQNSVRAVLFLVLTFFCMAALWLLIEAEFLAIVLVLVYVGAVMVLFLFVVMMLDTEAEKTPRPAVIHWLMGLLVACLMLALIGGLVVGASYFGLSNGVAPEIAAQPASYSNIKSIGEVLYSQYLLPFEIAGVVLLVAMIAAIALTFRGPRGTKAQQPGKQVQVTKADRLSLVSMPSETETGGTP